LVRGKRVLDIACREGFGTRILAETAESVTGLDSDAIVVQAAAIQHRCANLQFLVGSRLSIPVALDHGFDAIVCFDAMDDTDTPERLLSEIKRLSHPNGVLILSVPNAGSGENLFRSKAFSAQRFQELLQPQFAQVQLLSHSLFADSVIRPDGSANGAGPAKDEAQYLMAIASNSAAPSTEVSTETVSIIPFLYDKEKSVRALLDMKAYQDETIKRQERQLAGQKQTLVSLEEGRAWQISQIESLTHIRGYLEQEIDNLRKHIASNQEALAWRAAQVADLQRAIQSRDEALAWRATQVENLENGLETLKARIQDLHRETSARIAQLTQELESIHASTGWKWVLRMRSIRSSLRRLLGNEG
jgi:2-polyprenyl-3-methyl-5-hydroxy-6-metoxy-1,4-benzoquinol methylase